MKALLSSCSVLLLTFATLEAATIKRCNIQFKCSLDENSVSATDGKMCYVFRNGCMLAKENCNRRNKCQQELHVIKRGKCKTLCTKFCPEIYKPICCFNNKSKETFPNQCHMNRYICKSGKTCSFIQPGRCSSDL